MTAVALATDEEIEASPICEAKPATAIGTRKRGGQPGNANNLRHGLHSSRPDRWCSSYGNRNVNQFRRAIEEAVVNQHAGISVYAAALIQTATEATRAAIANREILAGLLDSGGAVKPELRLSLDREYLSHLDRRDKKLFELGLSVDQITADPTQQNISTKFGITLEEIRAPFTAVPTEPTPPIAPQAPPAEPPPAS